MIKNIEDLKNIQIVCRNQEQVKDCLNYLEQLGFNVSHFRFDYCCIIFYENNLYSFCVSDTIHSDLIIEYYNKEFVKTLKKFIKEKEEVKTKDFKVAKDGRIIKVNNKRSGKKIFIIDWEYGGENSIYTDDMAQNYLDFVLKYGLAYTTQEARDRAKFKMEIKTKLKNIAERLNKGQKIDWEDEDQKKFLIYYDYTNKRLGYDSYSYCKIQEVIHCLDINFLDVAKQEIGEQDLIKYFTE